MKNILTTKIFYYHTVDAIRRDASEQPKNDITKIIDKGQFSFKNYKGLDSKIQALENLKIGEEITQKDFDTIQKGIQESIQNKLQNGKWIRVYDEETIRKFARYAGKSEQADTLVEEMQKFNNTPSTTITSRRRDNGEMATVEIRPYAPHYEGFLKLKDGKLVLEDSKTNILPRELQDDTDIDLKLGISAEKIASNLQKESLNTNINTITNTIQTALETQNKQEKIKTPAQQEFQNTKNLHEATEKLIKLNTQQELVKLQKEIWVREDGKIGRNTLKTYFDKISDTTAREDAIKKFQEAIGLTGNQIDGKIGKQTERMSMAYYEQQLAKNKDTQKPTENTKKQLEGQPIDDSQELAEKALA